MQFVYDPAAVRRKYYSYKYKTPADVEKLLTINHANKLIASGDVIRPDSWVRPTAEMENAYLQENGYDKYCLWFLGVDPELSEDTKGHYGYIYTSDFKTVDRRGLAAIRQYAAQNNMNSIFAAAGKMIEAIDAKE